MKARLEPHLQREGYSSTAARTNPHEGGPEFEARAHNGGLILGVAWGHYLSRFLEQQAEEGLQWTCDEALELFGITAETAKQSEVVFANRNGMWAYIEAREESIHLAIAAELRPIQEALRLTFDNIVSKICLDHAARNEVIARLKGEQESLIQKLDTETVELRPSLSKIGKDLGSALERWLNITAFGPDEELEKATTSKKRLQAEYDTLCEQIDTLEKPLQLVERDLEILTADQDVCRFTDLFEALVHQLETLQSTDQFQYSLWRQALIELIDTVDAEARHHELDDTHPVSQIWLEESQMRSFRYTLSTRNEVIAQTKQRMAFIDSALRTANLYEKPLIPA